MTTLQTKNANNAVVGACIFLVLKSAMSTVANLFYFKAAQYASAAPSRSPACVSYENEIVPGCTYHWYH